MSITDAQMKVICEQATGIIGAGDYQEVFEKMDYPYLEILDWTSSTGDWQFIVSRDGKTWYVAGQDKGWSRSGFDYWVDEEHPFYGNVDEVLEMLA